MIEKLINKLEGDTWGQGVAEELAREIAELVEPYIQQAYLTGCANSLRQAAEVFQAEALTGSPLTPGNIALRLNRMAGQYDAG